MMTLKYVQYDDAKDLDSVTTVVQQLTDTEGCGELAAERHVEHRVQR